MPVALRQNASLVAFFVAAALAAGCTTTPTPPPPAPAPEVQSLADLMSEAGKARNERQTTRERDTYRQAARQYPTAKEPWARLAESYFEAGDYGNAILAAQEVLQRDAADSAAAGVLAVSGLRVSTQALAALRSQNTKLSADTRTQAEDLTKKLRELVGESVLVPQPAEPVTAAAPAASAPARRVAQQPRNPNPAAVPAAATRPVSAATPAAPAAPNPVKPTSAPAPAAPKNPFDALK